MQASLIEIEQSFKEYLNSINHPINSNIEFDTKNWPRYQCPHSSKGNKNVSYKAHSDGRPCLKVQCHKCHPEIITFQFQGHSQFTSAQREKMLIEVKKKKALQEKQQKNALITMRTEWENAKSCTSHPYFDRKGLVVNEADGLKIDILGRVLCPIRLITGDLISSQTIPFKGKKKFHYGVSPKNGFHNFGSIEACDTILFAEGIATSLLIKESIQQTVICVYGKHFDDIALIIKTAYPHKKFIYCCDLSSEGEKVTSEDNARKAILLAGGTYALPDFSLISDNLKPDIKRSDFNDLFMLLITTGLNRTAALDIVRQQLAINFDGVIMPESKKKETPKAAEVLLELIDQSGFEFFHDDHQIAFCKYPSQRSNIHETRRLRDKNFASYLSYIYRQAIGKTIGEIALKEALNELEGRALYDKCSRQEKIFLRAGELNGKIYIDLCNDKWQAIEISSAGWKILESKNIPIRFERSQHALSLPDPNSANTGDISKLWEIVNIPKDDQILVLAFILESFRCTTAFPILVLLGLQDSGKSATQNTIRSLIDPSASNLRTPPRKADDLVVEAASNWLISYNNASALSDEMHDDFCCISTGSGFATRKLFKDLQQVVVNICRPVIINGIFNFIRRPDLLDRAIILELDSIDESKRKTDTQLNRAMRENLPSIFRGLLDLFVKVLELLPGVTLDNQPRMADYALLGVAVEMALGLPVNTFIHCYKANRASAKENILDSSPVMLAIVEFIERQEDKFWRGLPSELLAILTKFKEPSIHTLWPKSSHAMGGELRRYTASLCGAGIQVINEAKISGKKNRAGNIYRISKTNTHKTESEKTNPQSPPSPHYNEKPSNDGALQGVGGVDIGVDFTAMSSTESTRSPRLEKPANPQPINVSDTEVDIVDLVDIKIDNGISLDPDSNKVLI